ncbi:unnamed protein product [Rhodiola kirilowii]
MAFKALLISFVGASFAILTILTQAASSFDFIKNLKGSQKGDQVKGIADLKKYLQHFGYLNYHTGLESYANDDDFDDHLEDALRTYQANFHLNTSGTLDDDTITSMLTTRCGVPDIVNCTSWMQSRKPKYRGDRSHPGYNFLPGSPKWPPTKTHLTFGFDSSVPTSFRQPIEDAFEKWALASSGRFLFSEAASYDEADLKIAFERGDHGDTYPFGGRGGHFAHAFPPTDGRMHFNADVMWSIGAQHQHYDVGTAALHEIGHLLGLGHSSTFEAVMHPGYFPNMVKGHLTQDDIKGIRALYNIYA